MLTLRGTYNNILFSYKKEEKYCRIAHYPKVKIQAKNHESAVTVVNF